MVATLVYSATENTEEKGAVPLTEIRINWVGKEGVREERCTNLFASAALLSRVTCFRIEAFSNCRATQAVCLALENPVCVMQRKPGEGYPTLTSADSSVR
eukprot:scaffold9009_cov130-Isochrysis_galbana.AAC.11